MSQLCKRQLSPRHGFSFSEVPTVRGNRHGGSVVFHYPDTYGSILDCVYEMADDISNGNGVPVETAIESVLHDEGWRLLPKHKKMIVKKLST